MISCLIIDDEPLAIDLLKDYTDRISELKLINTFTNPIEAVTFLKNNEVDLLFLDIQMPELNGLDLIRIISPNQAVVLTTAYGEYALESYEFRVFDYLLKPISFDRFEKSIQKVNGFLNEDFRRSGTSEPNPKPKISKPILQTEPNYIFIKSGQQTLRVDLHDITHISGSGDYATLFKTDGSKILTLENMVELAKRLPERHFARIHRSHIVALGHIDFIERKRVAIGKVYLPISDSYIHSFLEVVNA